MPFHSVPCDYPACTHGFVGQTLCPKCGGDGRILLPYDEHASLKIARWINGFLFALVFSFVLWGIVEGALRLLRHK
jgi:hypothetical protein